MRRNEVSDMLNLERQAYIEQEIGATYNIIKFGKASDMHIYFYLRSHSTINPAAPLIFPEGVFHGEKALLGNQGPPISQENGKMPWAPGGHKIQNIY